MIDCKPWGWHCCEGGGATACTVGCGVGGSNLVVMVVFFGVWGGGGGVVEEGEREREREDMVTNMQIIHYA